MSANLQHGSTLICTGRLPRRQHFNSPHPIRGEDTLVVILTGLAPGDGTLSTGAPCHVFTAAMNLRNDKILKWTDNRSQFKLALSSISIVRVNNFVYLLGTDGETFVSVAKRFEGSSVMRNCW